MLQQEFEQGIGIDLTYLPTELKAQWFKEVEEFYLASDGSKEDAYKAFRRQIAKRVQAFKEFRFSSNLELRACLRIALQRLDAKYDYRNAQFRHRWIAYIESLVGSDDLRQNYGAINVWVQSLRDAIRIGMETFLPSELYQNAIQNLKTELSRTGRFDGDEFADDEHIALTIVHLIFSEFDQPCPWVSSLQYCADHSDKFRYA